MPPPTSELFHVESSPSTGRRIHASQFIPANTPLLITPALSTCMLFREYKREVCAFCFAYNRGRNWSLRDADAGLAWCSEECRVEWLHFQGPLALEAFRNIERLVRKAGQKTDDNGNTVNGVAQPPSPDAVEKAWAEAAEYGQLIISARGTDKTAVSKAARRALQTATSGPADPAVLSHFLSGILLHANHSDLYCSMTELHAASQPYKDQEQLQIHISTYHQLLALLPEDLLPSCTPDIVRAVQSRDLPNSFGIRSLDDAGDEIFGFGVWPEASYWNHSCTPNVQKRRVGRAWEFWTARAIEEGEELCITYLGGEEETLNVRERRERLGKTWGFVCGCGKCEGEAGLVGTE